MTHPVLPTTYWVCVHDGERREVPVKYVGEGAPACPKCQQPMVREESEVLKGASNG